MPLRLQRRQRGVYSKLVHGTGATSVAALKVAQINCVEDWTVPDHSVICDVHTKRIGLVCVGGVNVALHSVFPQKVHFFPQLFSFYPLYYNWPSWQISHQIVTTCGLSTAQNKKMQM